MGPVIEPAIATNGATYTVVGILMWINSMSSKNFIYLVKLNYRITLSIGSFISSGSILMVMAQIVSMVHKFTANNIKIFNKNFLFNTIKPFNNYVFITKTNTVMVIFK